MSGPTALALFVAIALLAAWSLWRERNAVGRRWAVAFWVLRVAAFGCALWMLAGPTQLRIERTTTTSRSRSLPTAARAWRRSIRRIRPTRCAGGWRSTVRRTNRSLRLRSAGRGAGRRAVELPAVGGNGQGASAAEAAERTGHDDWRCRQAGVDARRCAGGFARWIAMNRSPNVRRGS